MDVVVEQRTVTTVVRITGSVDGLTADALLSALQAQIEAGNTRLIADLSGVSYTSSAGLRALLATVKQARSAGGDFRLASVMPPVHKVLEMSGFTTILKLYPDVELAVASFPA
ncbi:MAG TPA: STAS domain-containing protein [Gemmatimonadaceae bacterium]|jgi:anti-anti-sigma factor|nr:STAS domain-containing protein [Gemmatimonadaceae bacterium]